VNDNRKKRKSRAKEAIKIDYEVVCSVAIDNRYDCSKHKRGKATNMDITKIKVGDLIISKDKCGKHLDVDIYQCSNIEPTSGDIKLSLVPILLHKGSPFVPEEWYLYRVKSNSKLGIGGWDPALLNKKDLMLYSPVPFKSELFFKLIVEEIDDK
jgi:hypothetical protein